MSTAGAVVWFSTTSTPPPPPPRAASAQHPDSMIAEGNTDALCSFGVRLKALPRNGVHANVRLFIPEETRSVHVWCHAVKAGDAAFTGPAADHSPDATCWTKWGTAGTQIQKSGF